MACQDFVSRASDFQDFDRIPVDKYGLMKSDDKFLEIHQAGKKHFYKFTFWKVWTLITSTETANLDLANT
ncbi:unnamed protein product [Rhizophagus irregularis]|nr:unnamed protein product [Rhizophagus irregularis]